MHLIGQPLLTEAGKKNAPLRAWLEKWSEDVKTAVPWTDLKDVQVHYPRADGVKLKSKRVVTVFDVKGNSYRLLTYIDYEVGIVRVLAVLTHAEYDKGLWKDKY